MLPRGLLLISSIFLAVGTNARAEITARADPPRLTWSRFRPADSMIDRSEDAHIAAEMSFPEALRVEQADGGYRLPGFTITVAPEPSRTIVRRSVPLSEELLRHEQGHYDLVFLAARTLARELATLRASSAGELTRIAEEAITEHTNRAARLSERYDRETDHSRDRDGQARWNELIRAALGDPRVTRIAGLPL